MATGLTVREAKAFYDRWGARQDLQAFYEDPALADLVAHADFDHAGAVFEFGCGTGRLAQRLLARHLPNDSRYLGVDVSSTMVDLARARLARWRDRAEVQLTDGSTRLAVAAGGFDRFVSTYVLDLLSVDDIALLLAEAHRVLARDGSLCVVSLTQGVTRGSRLVLWAWKRLYALRPTLVGGCRPIRAAGYLPHERWEIAHHDVVTSFGISSEVLVAQRTGPHP